jgi:hypothetical protein
MTETVLIIGTVGVLIIIMIVIFRGQKLKKLKFSKLEAEFASDTEKSKSIVLLTEIPERVAWLDLALKLNGISVCHIKVKDRGGQVIAREVVAEKEGPVHYTIEANGSQRLYNANGKLTPIDYIAFGSGQVNIVNGEKYIIHEVTELGAGGAKFSLCLETFENYENGILPDDIADAEIMRMINES